MPKFIPDRSTFDHPEHFDDEIRDYRTSSRYRPTPLEQALYEMAGHQCTICKAPWLEIHHIVELADDGETAFDNLIVLCPNCHTRVHQDGVPSRDELRHYKLKQEVAYELPVLARLSPDEWNFIEEVAARPASDQISYAVRRSAGIDTQDHVDPGLEFRRHIGLLTLQESGMVTVEEDLRVGLANGTHTQVTLSARCTGKGVRWIRYLVTTGRLANRSS